MATAQEICDLLGDMFKADPAATAALLAHRVPCGAALVQHPGIITVRAGAAAGDECPSTVGLLGVLNGLCHAGPGSKIAAALYNDHTGELLGFCPVLVVE